MRLTLLFGGALAAAAAAAQAASAQEAPAVNQSVTERAQQANGAQGVSAGSFRIYPTLDLSTAYSDNVFAVEDGAEEDTYVQAAPSIRVQSNWSRHAVGLSGNYVARRYSDLDDENIDDWGYGADGRLDIGSNGQVFGRAQAARLAEPRTSGFSPAGLRAPIEYDTRSMEIGGSYAFNRFRTQLRYLREEFDFEDGVIRIGGVDQPFDQDERDVVGDDIEARIDFALSPDSSLFLVVTERIREFDTQGPTVQNRDSEGRRALAGARFDILRVARGEVAVGQSNTEFDDASLGDIEGFSASARVEWFPSDLTTVTLEGLRDTFASAIAGSYNLERSRLGVRVDHELRRNIVLTGGYAWEDDEFSGVDRQDQRDTAELGVEYYLNRLVGVGVSYQRREQTSEGAARDRTFEVNELSLRLRLRR